jgi:hypothetical protein
MKNIYFLCPDDPIFSFGTWEILGVRTDYIHPLILDFDFGTTYVS